MKKNFKSPDFKLGILGGGQLGKMMAIAIADWHLPIYFLDQSKDFPAGPYGFDLVEGNFKDYDDVMAFGKDMDVLSIEIEHVNTKALRDLEQQGVIVHPAPDKLEIIKDKGLQKQFYTQHQLPTSPYQLFPDKQAVLEALSEGSIAFPFVQKSRTAGYDGKGVAVIRNNEQVDRLLEGPCLIEDLVEIEKELAVIVARNPSGEIVSYPTVEMEFHPTANLVEYLLCPAKISPEQEQTAQELAKKTIDTFGLCGLLAVELFLDKQGNILINEVAPRPHNSGHHTIDSNYTSQFEQHIRAILDLPLGSTKTKTPVSVMINLLGAPDHTGPANYEGLKESLELEGVYPHLYGKKVTKPYRKMGHATIIGDEEKSVKEKAKQVKDLIRITAL